MRHHNRSRGYFWGIILIALGLLFLLQNMDYLDVGNVFQDYWPAILILIGVKMLFDRRKRSTSETHFFGGSEKYNNGDTHSKSDSFESTSAEAYNNIFGDIRLRFDDRAINKFFTNNVFGDIDLDFSQSKFEESASIRVNGIFGDVEIKIHDAGHFLDDGPGFHVWFEALPCLVILF